MSISLIITALFIGLAVMPVTAGPALSVDNNEEETLSSTEGGGAKPVQTQPPTAPPCPNCLSAILQSAIATMPSRAAAIQDFVDLVWSMGDMTPVEFTDALAAWLIDTRAPIILELGNYLLTVYDFDFDVAAAVDIAYNALENYALDLYDALTDPEHPAYPLEHPVLTTIVTVDIILFLFVIITGGALLIQCAGDGLNVASMPVVETTEAGATGSASL